MATESITKPFIVDDDETCEKLIKALNEHVPQKIVTTNRYEEGKKKLKQYAARYKKC